MRQQPHERFLHDLVKDKTLHTCTGAESVREAARRIIAGADAIAVVDEVHRARAIVTPHDLVEWIARDGADPGQPITCVPHAPAITGPLNATVTDGALMMAQSKRGVVVITADGTTDGRLHAVVSARDVARVFGDQPISILHDVALARNLDELGALNVRARRFTLEHLTGPSSLEWLARFTHLVDVHFVKRIIALGAEPAPSTCWCFYGAAGRGESLTLAAPGLAVIVDDEQRRPAAEAAYRAVLARLPIVDTSRRMGPSTRRCTSRARPSGSHATKPGRAIRSFRRRTRHGPSSTFAPSVVPNRSGRILQQRSASPSAESGCTSWPTIASPAFPRSRFFRTLSSMMRANSQMSSVSTKASSLPWLKLDASLDWRQEPGSAVRRSSRFAMAQRVFAMHESIFRDAAETLRMVLWQQGRAGITQGTDGSELPPALLSGQDRDMLKGSFRSILRLVQFTADPAWIRSL